MEELGLSVEVEYVTDMEKIMAYGVMSMPAIVVNEHDDFSNWGESISKNDEKTN